MAMATVPDSVAPTAPPPVLKAPAGKAPAASPAAVSSSLLGQATTEAGVQIGGEVAPLAAQVSAAVKSSDAAQSGIGAEYKALLPSVADSASRLENFDKQLVDEQQGVYTQAGQNLNALHQNAAADAQSLAQRIGGPVSTGQFTAAVDPYQGAEAAGAANAALGATTDAMSGARSAEQFAGQVFPALQTEDQARSRTYYNDLISKIKDRIATITSTKGTLISNDLGKLQTAQEKNNLDQAKFQLSTLNAENNWRSKQRSLDQADAKLQAQITEHQQSLQASINEHAASLAETTRQHGVSDSIQSARLGLTAQHDSVIEKLDSERVTIAEQKNAMALVDAAMAGSTGGKPVTLSVKVPIANPGFQLKPNPNLVHDPKTGQWYEWTKRTLTPAEWAQQSGTTSATGTSDPNRLYQLLIGAGTPQSMALSVVRSRLALPGSWKPGKKAAPATPTTTTTPASPLFSAPPTQGGSINLGEIPYAR